MLAIRHSETSEEDGDDEEEEGEAEGKNDCQCHKQKGQSHISNKEGQKEKEFLSKRIDSKQRLRGYVNLRGIDVPLPWMIWYGDDLTCGPFHSHYYLNRRKYLRQFLRFQQIKFIVPRGACACCVCTKRAICNRVIFACIQPLEVRESQTGSVMVV